MFAVLDQHIVFSPTKQLFCLLVKLYNTECYDRIYVDVFFPNY